MYFLINKTTCLWGFPGGSVVKNPPASARDTDLIPDLGRCCRATIEPVLQSPGTATAEAYTPQSPCSTTRETTTVRCHAHCRQRVACLPQLERSLCCNKNPTQPPAPQNKNCVAQSIYIEWQSEFRQEHMLEFRPISTFLGPNDGNVHRNFNPYFKHSETSQLKIKKETGVAVDR